MKLPHDGFTVLVFVGQTRIKNVVASEKSKPVTAEEEAKFKAVIDRVSGGGETT